MTETNSDVPEFEKKPAGIEQLVSSEALSALNEFCIEITDPEKREKIRSETETIVKISADFSLENNSNPEWTPAYDAVLFRSITTGANPETGFRLLNSYESEHKLHTLAILSDMEKLEIALGVNRGNDEALEKKMTIGLSPEHGMTPSAFETEFEYATPKDVLETVKTLTSEAAVGYASSLLYRLNRTREYTQTQALKDIIDTETFFVPMFKLGYDGFSMGLYESAETARLDRAGKLAELDKSKYILGESFGDDPEAGVHLAVLQELFNGYDVKHIDEQGNLSDGLSIRSAIGYRSGEHKVVFCVLKGFIDGEEVKGRARVKGIVSNSKKLKQKDYENLDLEDPTTWPQDLEGVTLITGQKSEDENETVDMEAENKNVTGVAKVLRSLATHIVRATNNTFSPQSSPSRKEGKWVHIRGDKMYTESVDAKAELDPTIVDVVTNNDTSFQVSKLTTGVSVNANGRTRRVNTEVQIMTRRARKNSRENDGAHWLYKVAEAVKKKLGQNAMGVAPVIDKHHDPLGAERRSIAQAYLGKIRLWLRSQVAESPESLECVENYRSEHGLGY